MKKNLFSLFLHNFSVEFSRIIRRVNLKHIIWSGPQGSIVRQKYLKCPQNDIVSFEMPQLIVKIAIPFKHLDIKFQSF